MAYTDNPRAPRVRRDAAAFAKKHGVRTAARRFGVSPGTITKRMRKAMRIGEHPIPTKSSKPRHHPKQISNELVWQIFSTRLRVKRSAEVVHQILKEQGVLVSLTTVKRTLDRTGLLKKRSPWKRFHPHVERPLAERPGSLVQLDTIHTMLDLKKRMYTFTLIDVYSRWAYAKTYPHMNAAITLRFLAEAQAQAPFHFEMLQTDHGPEFGKWFVERAQKKHRHSRIGKPNDNAHIERFNRTLQEECLDKVERTPEAFNKALGAYIPWYNSERHHFGLALSTPLKYLKCFQAID
ncbi:MAG: DDE-type integrase/transposase/recombinase [Patescibacteria group bacterium]|nr:DDE-type integrase/transposase/recombinase [Patescibacteria group bacterium]MDE1965640.1 DDE-type integrase/transposase/recombinase [Patescibacteria group bacterium]